MKQLLIFILAIPLTLSQYDYGEKRDKIELYKLHDSKGKKDKKCTAKGRFKDENGCNWCFCDKGSTVCTSMHCDKKKEKLVSNVESCKNKPMGRFKAEDGCNWCFCIDANTPICTQMGCYKQKMKRSKDSNVCKAKDRKPGRFLHPDGCNWCYCIGSIQMMCTIMGCPKLAGPSEDGISTQFVFQSGKFRFVDSGSYTMCIRESGKSKGIKAPKKRRFPDYANTDYTDDLLRPEKTRLNEKIKKEKSLKVLAQECKAGSKFKDPFGCNWCNCIEDGVVICDHDECKKLNKDKEPS
ncbi:uncharacterized protein LOC134802789 [Cydia splendana]|uniref:uncharacterized protein LOC134802789 n=1 Tax=Cydia splendana TaxID=1100963 RepID=UPI0028F483F2